ncbi:MAG TPA: hypothetical protein VF057_02360 [Thermoanaerobaculia bacterium]
MRPKRPRRCTYLVAADPAAADEEIGSLAAYLSTLHDADCDVVVVDRTAGERFETRQRTLRWVARHVAIGSLYTLPNGDVDLLQAAVDIASCEKVIIAAPESRYSAAEIASLCAALERHEAVEPQEFVGPMSWWGGIDAGRMLLQRGLDQPAGAARTFAFRKSAWRPLRGFEERPCERQVRRLLAQGVDLSPARDVFVRCEPPSFATWARRRARDAAADPLAPIQALTFAGLLPFLAFLFLIGGGELAGGYAGMIAIGSVVVAARGRVGARHFFPLRACFFAPLWLVERAVTIYWTLFARITRGRPRVVPVPSPAGRSEAANR